MGFRSKVKSRLRKFLKRYWSRRGTIHSTVYDLAPKLMVIAEGTIGGLTTKGYWQLHDQVR
jgi:hypothetical protein